MKPARLAIRLGVLAVIVATALAVALIRGSAEPIYEGKPLGQWLKNHTASTAANPPYGSPGWHKANDVLRAAGSNAVPTLLKMIAAKDPPAPVLKLLDFAWGYRVIKSRYHRAVARNDEACYAFEVLGTNAGCAVPALIRLYERPPTQSSQNCVAEALGHRIGQGGAAGAFKKLQSYQRLRAVLCGERRLSHRRS